jgi:hypothetical protein
VVQTIVATEPARYSTVWLLISIGSLILFVVSAEQLGESIREVDIATYLRSAIFYNAGVLLLFLSLYAIFDRYAAWGSVWSTIIFILVLLTWFCLWGRDTVFLLRRGEQYDRWKRKMDGELVEGEILDQYDILIAWIRRQRG